MFTQPAMYKKIAAHPSTREIYARRLEAEGVVEPGGGDALVDQQNEHLNQEFEAGVSYKPNKADWLDGKWSGFKAAHGDARRGQTSVEFDTLRDMGKILSTVPEGLTVNSKLRRVLNQKQKMF
jgi:2-oxoglutarate dehydrogenase E1 component